jgi:hypothetical protein
LEIILDNFPIPLLLQILDFRQSGLLGKDPQQVKLL